jgi:hypothetical protein
LRRCLEAILEGIIVAVVVLVAVSCVCRQIRITLPGIGSAADKPNPPTPSPAEPTRVPTQTWKPRPYAWLGIGGVFKAIHEGLWKKVLIFTRLDNFDEDTEYAEFFGML